MRPYWRVVHIKFSRNNIVTFPAPPLVQIPHRIWTSRTVTITYLRIIGVRANSELVNSRYEARAIMLIQSMRPRAQLFIARGHWQTIIQCFTAWRCPVLWEGSKEIHIMIKRYPTHHYCTVTIVQLWISWLQIVLMLHHNLTDILHSLLVFLTATSTVTMTTLLAE